MRCSRWLLLTHQLPSEPSNIRVKVWRKLRDLGAVPIKNSIYVLPNLPGTKEDFEWLRKEILQDKGEASIFLADSITDLEDKEIVAAFQKARGKDFERFLDEAMTLADRLKTAVQGRQIHGTAFDRLERRWTAQKMDWDRLRKVDFFKSPGGSKSEALMEHIQKLFQEAKTLSLKDPPKLPSLVDIQSLKGRVWVTRKSPHVDRLACAWIIRRRIDPKAKFKFVAEPYNAKPNELRFDMAEGEFTHVGDWCSFETFLYRLNLKEPPLQQLGEIVHDIDLKDKKFGRLEAFGFAELIRGICKLHSDDSKRAEAGAAAFDALYAALQK